MVFGLASERRSAGASRRGPSHRRGAETLARSASEGLYRSTLANGSRPSLALRADVGSVRYCKLLLVQSLGRSDTPKRGLQRRGMRIASVFWQLGKRAPFAGPEFPAGKIFGLGRFCRLPGMARKAPWVRGSDGIIALHAFLLAENA